MQTGSQITGRPCLGSWASYGLGSENKDLPAFVVLVAIPSNREQEQAISARLWSAGVLPGEHAGVSFRSKGDPILYVNNPPGVPEFNRRFGWLVAFVSLAFLVLIGRLWQLQVVRGDQYYQRSTNNFVKERWIEAVRGKVVGTERHVVGDKLRDLRQHRHHALLVALAGDGDGVGLRLNVAAREAERLGDAQARAVEQRQHGGVARQNPRLALLAGA